MSRSISLFNVLGAADHGGAAWTSDPERVAARLKAGVLDAAAEDLEAALKCMWIY